MSLTKWVLVTGGTGLAGANLVKALVGRGYSVRALDLPDNSKLRKLEGLDVEIMEGNSLGPGVAEAAMAGR